MELNEKYDVIVVGAGIVGLTLAAILSNLSIKVAICDRSDEPKLPVNRPDIRVVALSHASIELLEKIGVWQDILGDGAYEYRSMKVWEKSPQECVSFVGRQLGLLNLGYIAENVVIQKYILDKLKTQSNVDIFHGKEISSVESSTELATVTFSEGESLNATLVVGADGLRSTVRSSIGGDFAQTEVGQHAVVAHLSASSGFQRTAWQAFLSTGTVAFLPVGVNDCILVWSLPSDVAKEYVALDQTDFIGLLQDISNNIFGELSLQSDRKAFPLNSVHAKTYCVDRLVLAGDAAHSIHPLAGQGVNLGMLDASALVDVIASCLARKRDIGLLANLRPYERARKADNELMRSSLDMLNKLFRSENDAIKTMRQIGLSITERSSFLKRRFIEHALGRRIG